MVKNLFLYGAIGAGKSSLIRDCLHSRMANLGGFFVQRIFQGEQLRGFSLVPVDEASEYQLNYSVGTIAGLKNLFLFVDEKGNWQRNDNVFQVNGVKCLQNSLRNDIKLVLLDELGGVELNNAAFMSEVYKILDSATPVLGVVKAPGNAKILESAAAGKGVTGVNRSFIDRLYDDRKTELYLVDQNNRDEATLKVKNFVEAVFDGQEK